MKNKVLSFRGSGLFAGVGRAATNAVGNANNVYGVAGSNTSR